MVVDPATAFASGIKPPADPKTAYDSATIDLRLRRVRPPSMPGRYFVALIIRRPGKAPDLVLYDLGTELPHYGPRNKP